MEVERIPTTGKEEEEDDDEHGSVPYAIVFRNKKVIMSTISCILGTIFLLFSEPIISDHLIEIGVSEHYIGKQFRPI
jgi:hypothetical protein